MSTAPSDINRRPRSVSSRVPPHNLEAEEAALGACLLSPVAVQQAVECHLEAFDFYKSAHQTIYAAVTSLYSQNIKIDAVTVADELRRAGVIDDCGGSQALLELQARTPAISTAPRYFGIVQSTAIARRVIYASSRIAEKAYGEGADALAVVDEARDLLTDQALLMPPTVGVRGRVADWSKVEENVDRDTAQPWVHRGIVRRGQRVALNGGGGAGKALAPDTLVPTVRGFAAMGRLVVGDEVLGSDGHPTKVVAVGPVVVGPSKIVTFEYGTRIVAHTEHEWLTWQLSNRHLDSPMLTETADLTTGDFVPTHDRTWRRVIDVADGVMREVLCIQVANPDGLYAVGGPHSVLTHNSTLLRQAAWCAENGLHFLTASEVGAAENRALIVEAEASKWDIKTVMMTLRNKVAHLLGVGVDHVAHPESLHRPEGFDLRDRRNRADLEAVLRDIRPALVCIGPLKYLHKIEGGENYETAAIEVQKIINDLIGRYDVAWMMETHSNSADNTATGGSKRWQDWPDCGVTMKWHEEKGDSFDPKGRSRFDLTSFRAPRDSDMIWPRALVRDPQAALPWMTDDPKFTGPTSAYHYVAPYSQYKAQAQPMAFDDGDDF